MEFDEVERLLIDDHELLLDPERVRGAREAVLHRAQGITHGTRQGEVPTWHSATTASSTSSRSTTAARSRRRCSASRATRRPSRRSTIADAKHLIFEGLLKATEQGVDPQATGCLVDEQFGAPKRVPEEAKDRGLLLAMPVEKSGQNEFDFEYGEDFGAHIEQFDPDFSKVLVRYNPEGDAEMNRVQAERLKRLADWLHEHDRKFLFELLVPAEPAPAGERWRRRGALRRRAASRADAPRDRRAPGRGHRGGHLEDRGDRHPGGLRADLEDRPARRPRRGHLRGAGPRRQRREGRALAATRARPWRAMPASRSAARSGGTPSRVSSTVTSSGATRSGQISEKYLRFVQVYQEAAREHATA